MASDESYLLNDESDNDGSDSVSYGTYYFYAFYLRFDDVVSSVSGLGSGIFVPTVVEFKYDIFAFVVLVPIGVESKGGQLIKMFWRSNSLFYFQI